MTKNLDTNQQHALQELREFILKDPVVSDSGQKDYLQPDDPTLIRFLKARSFSPKEAHTQYASTKKWRNEINTSSLFEKIDADVYEQARQIYPQWTGRRDYGGRPVYIYQICKISGQKVHELVKLNGERGWRKADDGYGEKRRVSVASSSRHGDKEGGGEVAGMKEASLTEMAPFIATSEGYIRFTCALCSFLRRVDLEDTAPTDGDGRNGDKTTSNGVATNGTTTKQAKDHNISLSTTIIDVSNFGMTAWWGLRTHFSTLANLNSRYYPETIYKVFIINAPWFFTKIWSWAKGWLDPGTVAKISILSASETKGGLLKEIPPESIPTLYGGKLKWEWNDHLQFDETFQRAFSVQPPFEYPVGPLECVKDEKDGKTRIYSLGSVGGKTRKEELFVSDR